VYQRSHITQDPVFRILSNCAGVDQYYIGSELVRSELKAHLTEHAAQFLTVRLILLAAIRINIRKRGFPGHMPLTVLAAYAQGNVPLNFNFPV